MITAEQAREMNAQFIKDTEHRINGYKIPVDFNAIFSAIEEAANNGATHLDLIIKPVDSNNKEVRLVNDLEHNIFDKRVKAKLSSVLYDQGFNIENRYDLYTYNVSWKEEKSNV